MINFFRPIFRPKRLAPARTPSTARRSACVAYFRAFDLHGGSVMMASSSSPLRHGFLVTSNVKQSSILSRIPYCCAARNTPGPDLSERLVSLASRSWIRKSTDLCLAFDGHRYRFLRRRIPNSRTYTVEIRFPQRDRRRAFRYLTVRLMSSGRLRSCEWTYQGLASHQ